MAKPGDFKFCTQLGFVKSYHKITPIGKCRCSLGLGDRPNILGFFYNISTTADAIDFKMVRRLWFTKAHHIAAFSVKRKSGRDFVLEELPKLWGFPLVFLQRPPCPLSVSGASCFAYHEAVFHSVTNNKMTLNHVHATFEQ